VREADSAAPDVHVFEIKQNSISINLHREEKSGKNY
jgi:hypothetical protein